MLEQRTKDSLLDNDVVENYQKHVKAIYQVGDDKTDDWKTVFGYPIEFVPQANPYEKYSGDTLEVQLLLDGKPLSNQLVFADYINSSHGHSHGADSHEHEGDGEAHSHGHSHDDGEHEHDHDKEGSTNAHSHEHEHDVESHSPDHSHDDGEHDHDHNKEGSVNDHTHEHEHDGEPHSHDHSHDEVEHSHSHDTDKEEHSHTNGQQLRTNNNGIVMVDLPEDGIYYLRTIHMVRATDSEELTHKSKWATLTFEVTHEHGEDTHTHDDHEHEDAIPTWVFIVGSITFIGLLFLIFRKKG